jgi:hypothetical protein
MVRNRGNEKFDSPLFALILSVSGAIASLYSEGRAHYGDGVDCGGSGLAGVTGQRTWARARNPLGENGGEKKKKEKATNENEACPTIELVRKEV